MVKQFFVFIVERTELRYVPFAVGRGKAEVVRKVFIHGITARVHSMSTYKHVELQLRPHILLLFIYRSHRQNPCLGRGDLLN